MNHSKKNHDPMDVEPAVGSSEMSKSEASGEEESNPDAQGLMNNFAIYKQNNQNHKEQLNAVREYILQYLLQNEQSGMIMGNFEFKVGVKPIKIESKKVLETTLAECYDFNDQEVKEFTNKLKSTKESLLKKLTAKAERKGEREYVLKIRAIKAKKLLKQQQQQQQHIQSEDSSHPIYESISTIKSQKNTGGTSASTSTTTTTTANDMTNNNNNNVPLYDREVIDPSEATGVVNMNKTNRFEEMINNRQAQARLKDALSRHLNPKSLKNNGGPKKNNYQNALFQTFDSRTSSSSSSSLSSLN
jgi:hypothetical protein